MIKNTCRDSACVLIQGRMCMDMGRRKSWVLYTLLLVLGTEDNHAGNGGAVVPVTEAPTGFDEQTNGLTTQGQFLADRETFNEQEQIADGLGPVYNAQS